MPQKTFSIYVYDDGQCNNICQYIEHFIETIFIYDNYVTAKYGITQRTIMDKLCYKKDYIVMSVNESTEQTVKNNEFEIIWSKK